MLHENKIISHIGLTDRDLAVIQCYFNIVSKLNKTYEFTDNDRKQDADVVFINSDDPDAIDEGRQLCADNPGVTPIRIGTQRQASANDTLTLKRPLVLKRLLGALDSITKSSNSTVHQSSKALHVLVVDDSFPVRKFMQITLPQLCDTPMYIEIAQSGEEALEKALGRQFDLIFLDVVMPGMDGYAVCKRLKVQKSAYVVMLTSKTSPIDKVRGVMSGCNAFVTKPPSFGRLRNILSDCAKRTADASVKRAEAAIRKAG